MKQRPLLLSLLTFVMLTVSLAFAPRTANAQTTVTIGEGNYDNDHLPFEMDFKYALTQQIYTKTEIGMVGEIQSISFYYAYEDDSFELDDIMVYMKTTTKTKFGSDTDMVPVSNDNKVFEGTVEATDPGWVTIHLDTPFQYFGDDNLLVCVYKPTPGGLGHDYVFRATQQYGSDKDCSIAYYSDSYCPDINNIGSFSGSKTVRDYLANIQLTMFDNITFTDTNVKQICVQNWDTNNDGELSYAEAAAVTSLGTVFKNNSTITSFNELQYFTGLTSIDNEAFSGCWYLTAITLPPNIEIIGDFSFSVCSSLTSIIIPNSVTTIDASAFRACAFTSITIPSSVTSIGENPFSLCGALASITVEEGNNTYNSPVGSNAIIVTNTNKLIVGCKNTVIPEGVTAIGAAAFMGYSGLTSINIPNSVTSIGAMAFSTCSGLTAITIPASVTYISSNAFYLCTNLTEMTVLASTPPTLGNWVFPTEIADIPVYVPACSIAAYRNYDNYSPWGGFTNFRSLQENYPWTEDFEGYEGNDLTYGCTLSNVMPSCWSYLNGTNNPSFTLYPTIITSAQLAHSGANCLEFSDRYVANYTQSEQIAILPSMQNVNHLTLNLWARNHTTDRTGYFEVGVMTNPTNASTFTKVGDATPQQQSGYSEYTFSFANYTGNGTYIAIRMPSADAQTGRCVLIDDVTIGSANIVFADPNVKQICVQHWDTNGDGELSYAEAAAVTSLGTVFKNNTTITSFNELQYFTELETIEEEAFKGCEQLASITLPQNLSNIGSYAFRECTSLTSVVIPATVTSIGTNPFAWCEALASITMGDGANNIYYCEGNTITNIQNHTLVTGCKNTVIPDNVTAIGDIAFLGCTGLTAIDIPSSVTSFGQSAFCYCEGLTSFTIPASVTYIGHTAFGQCTGLTELTVLATTPPTLNTDAFVEVPTNIPVYVPCESLVAYQTYDNGEPWGGFTNIIGAVTIGTGTRQLSSLPLMMEWNYSMTQQIFTAAEIGQAGVIQSIAFDYVYTQPFSLSDVKVYMKNVSKSIFDNNYDMVAVNESDKVFQGSFAATGAGWVTLTLNTPFFYDGTSNLLVCFYDCTDGYLGNSFRFNCTLISTNSVLRYYTDDPNEWYFDIQELKMNYSGYSAKDNDRNNIQLTFNNNANISFADATVKQICVQHWDSNHDGELSYAEAAAVTSLGEVFKQNTTITSFNELQYFTELETIEEEAFKGCEQLASITLPQNLSNIGSYAFRECTSLTSVVIPATVTSIGTNPFAWCEALASITMGDGANNIYYCEGNTITNIQNHTLVTGCKNTVIPDNVTAIGDIAFLGCTGLTAIDIPSSVTSFGQSAFCYCEGLTSFTIPASVTYIGHTAFGQCTGLTELTVLATTPPTLNTDAFVEVPTNIPVYVPCESLVAYQTYDNGEPWGGFTYFQCNSDECTAPTGLAVSDILSDRATFTWDAEEGATWQFVARTVGVSPSNWATNTNNYTVWDHLSPDTDYVFYLRKKCSNTEFSNIVYVSFTTKSATCAAPTNVQVLGTGVEYYQGTGYLGFTFSFTPGHPDQELWTYYISENPVLPSTYQQMGANGRLGSFNHTMYEYYPTDPIEMLEPLTTYFVWVGYNCGTNNQPEYVWSAAPAEVTMPIDNEYELSAGINWWTPLAQMTLEELEVALGTINGDILINSQDEGFLHREDGYWNGTLGTSTLNPGQMLKIVTEEGGYFWHLCVPAGYANIEIVPGYNWLGYTGPTTNIYDALGNFEPSPGDRIYDQDPSLGMIEYNGVGGWSFPNGFQLVNGHGYIYESKSSVTKTLTLPVVNP